MKNLERGRVFATNLKSKSFDLGGKYPSPKSPPKLAKVLNQSKLAKRTPAVLNTIEKLSEKHVLKECFFENRVGWPPSRPVLSFFLHRVVRTESTHNRFFLTFPNSSEK